jgi:hypothetical protein
LSPRPGRRRPEKRGDPAQSGPISGSDRPLSGSSGVDLPGRVGWTAERAVEQTTPGQALLRGRRSLSVNLGVAPSRGWCPNSKREPSTSSTVVRCRGGSPCFPPVTSRRMPDIGPSSCWARSCCTSSLSSSMRPSCGTAPATWFVNRPQLTAAVSQPSIHQAGLSSENVGGSGLQAGPRRGYVSSPSA